MLEALLERRRPLIDRAGTSLKRALRDCSSSREIPPRAKGSHPPRGARLPNVAILRRLLKTSFSGQGCLLFSELEGSARVLTPAIDYRSIGVKEKSELETLKFAEINHY